MKHTYIAITAFLFIIGCSSTNKESISEELSNMEQTSQEVVDTVEPETVEAVNPFSNEVVFNGTFVLPPQQQASITLSMNGIVKETSLLPGKYVSKGAVLAKLENPEFIDLQQMYLDATAQCEYLEKEYNRQEILSKEEAASQKKFQQSKADYLSQKSRKDAAAAQLKMLGVSPDELGINGISSLLEVRSPINGYVSNLDINIGKHIAAGESLCDIINKSGMLIKLTVYEKDIDKINIGSNIEFRINGMSNETFDAEIISIGQSMDNNNRSLEVYANVASSNEIFRPGMYINAKIVEK